MDFERAEVDQLRRLLDAVMAVGSDLSLPTVLERITTAATELVGARYGALGVLDADRVRLDQFITVGIDEAGIARIGRLPEGHGILGRLIVDPVPLRLPDLRSRPDSYGFPVGHPQMTSFLGVPIVLRDSVFGNLYLTEKAGGTEFDDVDEELVIALASAAALAIENARLHEAVRAATLVGERERIARDLHDDVIQRVFATGMALEAAALVSTQPEVVDRLNRAVEDLDATIRTVRSTIFELGRNPGSEISARQQVMAVCEEAAGSLGFEPSCSVDGPINRVVGASLLNNLVLTIREALSNIARHAGATSASVVVTVDQDRLDLVVVDDGVGLPEGRSSGHGLPNMAARATGLGGSMAIGAGPRGGTRLEWSIPVPGT